MVGSLILAALLLSPPVEGEKIDGHAASGRLTKRMNTMLASDKFAGCIVVLHEGRPIFEGATGYADRALGVRHTQGTKFRFHSVSKWVTGAYLASLMEGGLLKPDDPVSKFVLEWPVSAGGVTVEHLLTHTWGLSWSTNEWGAAFQSTPSRTLRHI